MSIDRPKYLLMILILTLVSFFAGTVFQKHGFKPWFLRSENIDSPNNNKPEGEWYRNKERDKLDEVDKNLENLGYLSGYEPLSEKKGVTVFADEYTDSGVNLIVSGHDPEVILVDMKGNVLYKWRYPWNKAFPRHQEEKPPGNFRKARLYDNGDIVLLFEYKGMIKLDRNSNLQWKMLNKAHHDVWITSDGNIHVLEARKRNIEGLGAKGYPVLETFITEYTENGQLVQENSVIKAIRKSKYAGLFDWTIPAIDILHTNTLKILEKDYPVNHPAFSAGSALVSFNQINSLGIIDLKNNELVWTLSGLSFQQHDPEILSSGNILFLDNNAKNWHSRVLEVNPLSREVAWKYTGNDTNGFFTREAGTVQRLSNGNTLVTETTAGRAFELTPNKKIAWEYYNPYRAGKKDELIASIFELKRYPYSKVDSWLQEMSN